jgi:8-oxo-dGTP pyrophosphatase MutT (NUDIX family)
MTPSVPRPAATIVTVRDSDRTPALELLLLRRNDKVAFMAGAYVFPGGRLDDDDYARARAVHAPPTHESRFRDLALEDELPYRLAAVREMQEEAGVILTIADLVPIAHWVTPEVETRRYDTRFFLARMPERQTAVHDAGEMTELAWLSPQHALDQCRAGRIMLPPPTWTTIKRLARFTTVDQALAWARTTAIVRVQPAFVHDGARKMLTLPGDPLHPAAADWEVPEDTRFVLEEGKGWKPVSV